MAEPNPKDADRKGGQNHNEENPEYENFQDTLKKVLSVPKEKVDEKLAEEKRGKEEEKRAG